MVSNLLRRVLSSFCGNVFTKRIERKNAAVVIEWLEDRALMSAIMEMAADVRIAGNDVATVKKSQSVTINKDGVVATLTMVGDGRIAPGETKVIARLTVSASRSTYYVSGLQEEMTGGGAKVDAMAMLLGGSSLSTIDPHGNGSGAFTGFSAGKIGKKWGSMTFDITMTASMDAAGEVVTVKFPLLSMRRLKKPIQFTGLLDQAPAINVTLGTAIPPVNNAGFTVTPAGGSNFDTNEGGSHAGTIVLNQKPNANVTITATASNPDLGIAPQVYVFTPDNWNVPQNILVTGGEDADMVDDLGTLNFSVNDAVSSTEYRNVLDQVFSGNIHDNDTPPVTNPGIIITGNPVTVNENGTATFGVVLASQPTSNVTIGFSSNDQTVATVQASVTFTPANWNIPQMVTVTGVPDANTVNGSTVVYVYVNDLLSANEYDPLPDQTVGVTVIDTTVVGPAAGFTLSDVPVTVNENGTATFGVVLNAQPTGNVTLKFTSNDPTAATVTTSVTFTTANWNVVQRATVGGVFDTDMVNDSTSIVVSVDDATSASEYDPLGDQTVGVTVIDTTTGGPVTIVNWDGQIVQARTDTATNVLNISGQNSFAANDLMTWWVDTNGDFNVDLVLGTALADANGAYIIQLNAPVSILAGALMEVRYPGYSTEGFHLSTFEKLTYFVGNTMVEARLNAGAVYDTMDPHLLHIVA